MKQNAVMLFVAVMNLLIFAFVAAMVYDMEGSLGGEEGVKDEDIDGGGDPGTDEHSASYYIQIGDIKGEARAQGHKEWIEVLSYSHGVSSPDSPLSSNSGVNSGASTPFTIEKRIDKSSPYLFNALRDEEENDVTLHALRYNATLGADGEHYLTINLTQARIVSITSGDGIAASTGTNVPPTEEVTFVFGYITWTYVNDEIVIEEEGNFPLDDPIGTDEEDDIVFLRPENNPLTRGEPALDEIIPLISFHWGISPGIPPKGIRISETFAIEPITITKEIDRNSPILYQIMSEGSPFNGTIEFHRGHDTASRADTTVYWRVMLSDARISDIEIRQGGANDGADSRPLEEITFNWDVLNMTWVEEDVSHEIRSAEVQEKIDKYDLDMFLTISDLPDRENDLGAGNTVTFEDIPMYEFHHELSQTINDTTGLPTGNSSHSYVQIVKDIDMSSPLLLKVLLSGETFDMTARFYRIKAERPSLANEPLEEYKVITFTNASVQSIKDPEGNMDMAHKEREHVSFCYQKITWTFTDGGITSEDDWEAPNV